MALRSCPNLHPFPFGFSLGNLEMFQELVQGLCSPFLGVFIMYLLPVRVSSKSLLLSIVVSSGQLTLSVIMSVESLFPS